MLLSWRRHRWLRWLVRWGRHFTVAQWRAIDRDTPDLGKPAYGRVLVVVVAVAIVVILQQYIGDIEVFQRWFPAKGPQGPRGDEYWDLKGFAWWAGWRVGGYLLAPLIAIPLLGDRYRDYYISPRGFLPHLPTYLVLFGIVLPAVVLASRSAEFRATYPFYRLANRSLFDLLAWEAMYAMQFFALEVFFRGFILQGLRRAIGANAVFVMVIPYCMIHFGKPMPETFGAIIAGTVLGTIAMRTRSIWGGVAIHVGVAVTMDMLALRACPGFGSGHFCE
ncbi:MAG TPA: type II CAAX endopeptidase family protein [Acidimicrobiia bacterium]|jgi:membrane protease YdiL (CAAX protease family)|nr:type II CAAX endopeptidase family protein [Acidimicrobiia bacterium]